MDKRGLSFFILARLVFSGAGRIGVAQAQETAPAFAVLTGTAYRLVDQTIIDGVVHDQTQVPVTDGRIAIPELGIDLPLAADGSFTFSNLPVSADLDNPTEVTVIFTAPGLGSFTYLHLRLYPRPVGPNLTPQLTDTPRVNDRSRFHPDRDRAPVNTSGAFPDTGGGGPVAAVSEQEDACGRSREPGEIAILGQTMPSAGRGTVRIPELDLTSEIVDGCFEFRNLILPQDPMLVSFEFRVEGYRPATWANYIVLSIGSAPIFTPTLEPGDEPMLIDPCPNLLSTPQQELSAAQRGQAQLCAQLADAGTLPETGGGGPVARSSSPVAIGLLALVSAALFSAGAAARVTRRPS